MSLIQEDLIVNHMDHAIGARMLNECEIIAQEDPVQYSQKAKSFLPTASPDVMTRTCDATSDAKSALWQLSGFNEKDAPEKSCL